MSDWKAVEQYFTVVLFVSQVYPVCNFGKFIDFGFGTVMSEWVNCFSVMVIKSLFFYSLLGVAHRFDQSVGFWQRPVIQEFPRGTSKEQAPRGHDNWSCVSYDVQQKMPLGILLGKEDKSNGGEIYHSYPCCF